MTTATPRLLVNIVEAAEALSVKPEQIRQWADEGAMPKPVKINGVQRWVLADLEQWVESKRS